VREVDEARLPPDPGDAGDATLAGIDSNDNGVRDDVERAIYRLHRADSLLDRALLKRGAKDLQQAVLAGAPGSDLNADTVADTMVRGVHCLFRMQSETPRQALAEIQVVLLDTPARRQAWQRYDRSRSGTVQRVIDVSDGYCRALMPEN
jgi:hypothetical protein